MEVHAADHSAMPTAPVEDAPGDAPAAARAQSKPSATWGKAGPLDAADLRLWDYETKARQCLQQQHGYVDPDYEFDAPKFFDFESLCTNPVTVAETPSVKRYFEQHLESPAYEFVDYAEYDNNDVGDFLMAGSDDEELDDAGRLTPTADIATPMPESRLPGNFRFMTTPVSKLNLTPKPTTASRRRTNRRLSVIVAYPVEQESNAAASKTSPAKPVAPYDSVSSPTPVQHALSTTLDTMAGQATEDKDDGWQDEDSNHEDSASNNASSASALPKEVPPPPSAVQTPRRVISSEHVVFASSKYHAREVMAAKELNVLKRIMTPLRVVASPVIKKKLQQKAAASHKKPAQKKPKRKLCPTIPKPFSFYAAPASSSSHPPKEEYVPLAAAVQQFLRTPPQKNQMKPNKRLQQLVRKQTVPHSPRLLTKMRAKPVNIKSTEERELEELAKIQPFKARPVNEKIIKGKAPLGVPPPPEPRPRPMPEPFAMPGEIITERKRREFEARVAREREEERKRREFHAHPPLDHPPPLPPKKVMPKVKPKPFNFETDQRAHRRKHTACEEHPSAPSFEAQPILPAVYDPFEPKHSEKPLTDPETPVLHTDMRAEERRTFDQLVEEKRALEEEERARLEAERQEQERREIAALRKAAVHHARPAKVLSAKPMVPNRSNRPATVPESPMLGKKRKAILDAIRRQIHERSGPSKSKLQDKLQMASIEPDSDPDQNANDDADPENDLKEVGTDA